MDRQPQRWLMIFQCGVLPTFRVNPAEGHPSRSAQSRDADAEVGAPRGQSLVNFAVVGGGAGCEGFGTLAFLQLSRRPGITLI